MTQRLTPLREQFRPGLREHQIGPGRMLRDPAVRDCRFNRCAIFLIAAARISELPVDHLDRQSPRMIGLYLSQAIFARRPRASRTGDPSLNFIFPAFVISGERFRAGPFGILISGRDVILGHRRRKTIPTMVPMKSL
jgi:hypothetical protein